MVGDNHYYRMVVCGTVNNPRIMGNKHYRKWSRATKWTPHSRPEAKYKVKSSEYKAGDEEKNTI